MNTPELELETVTPMFLHGHDNRIVELRPPPFKALFRYWWRAVQDCKADALRKTEAKLFGSTDGKAPFSIRIPRETKNLGVPIKYNPLPHKRSSKIDAYDVGKSFNLCLITKNTSDACCYKQIAKLSFLLGGIGNRSRRGFGSIRNTNWDFEDVFQLQQEILDTLKDIAGDKQFEMRDGIIEMESPPPLLPEYPVIRLIGFGKLTPDVGNLLKTIGDATHTHKDDALGYAKGRNRLASPIHVRVQKVGKKYIPIVTLLRWNHPGDPANDYKKQLKFIANIIK